MAGRRTVVPDTLARIAMLARITDAVEHEVIPRLLASDRSGDALARDVVRFGKLVLLGSSRQAEIFVARLRRDGTAVETLCTGLLAETARHLGDLWVSDRLSFAEVTLGTARLQRLLRELAPALERRRSGPEGRVSALFAAVPGEVHSFGLNMLAEFFRAEGWRVEVANVTDPAALLRLVQAERHDLLGISIACDVHLPMLAECCRLLAEHPRRRALRIVVGGPLLIERPDTADHLAIDGVATDPAEALVIAEHLVSSSASRRLTG